MKTVNFFNVFGAFLLSLGLSGCFKKPEVSSFLPPSEEILIGEFGTYSASPQKGGELFGLSSHKGIELAILEKNEKGGIRGKKIRLIQADTEGNKEKTISVVTDLITKQKVHLLLGEVFSELSLAAAPVAQAFKVPMVTPASTLPQVTETGNYIFRSCFIEPFQGSVMAQFAIDHLGLKKAVVLRNQESQYSHTLANFFIKDFKRLGGKILLDRTYSPNDSNGTSLWKQVAALKTDLIFIPDYADEAKVLIQKARKSNIRVTFLGGDGWDGINFSETEISPYLNAYFSNHFSIEDQNQKSQEFVKKFQEKYQEVPNALAALGYDAAQIALAAIEKSENFDRLSIRKALAETKNFEGATGIISINKSRNAIKPSVVLQVGSQKQYSYRATLNP